MRKEVRKNVDKKGFALLGVYLVLCLFFIFNLVLPGKAAGPDIALLVTQQAAAYKTVAKEIQSQFDRPVQVYDMKDSRKKDAMLVQKINQQNPKLIIALGDKAALLASDQLRRFPILIGMVLDMDKAPLKVAGVEGVGLQIPPKSVLTQLQLIIPNFKKIGVLSSQDKFGKLRESIRSSASAYGIQAVEVLVTKKSEIKSKVDRVFSGLDALWVLPDPNILDAKVFQSLVKSAKKVKKSLVVYSENFVRAGAFFSVSPDYQAIGQQMVLLAKKMLAKENVRPEQPYLSKFHYPIGTYSVLNTTTAKTIGLTLSQLQLGFIDRLVNSH